MSSDMVHVSFFSVAMAEMIVKIIHISIELANTCMWLHFISIYCDSIVQTHNLVIDVKTQYFPGPIFNILVHFEQPFSFKHLNTFEHCSSYKRVERYWDVQNVGLTLFINYVCNIHYIMAAVSYESNPVQAFLPSCN